MKICITGASGLVGSHVVKYLLTFKHNLVLLLREGFDRSLIFNEIDSCDVVEGDIQDEIILEKIFIDCDIVIHCAGLVSFNPSRNREIFDVNVLGTTNVVNACLNSKIKKLIHVSSISALGRSEITNSYNEDSKWEDSGFNSSYAKSKYLAELEVFRGGEEGLDFSIINPSVIIGTGDISRSSTRLLGFVKKFNYFYPNGFLNVVDVRDVARVIGELISIKHKNRLVLNSESITYKQLYDYTSEIYKIKSPTKSLPLSLIKLGSYIDQVRRFFVGGEPFITSENLKFLGTNFSYFSIFYDKLFDKKLISAKESIQHAVTELEMKAKL
ncbi:MAG: NAD-dependent epimerase/dehydratase family protein [Opitutaceae bacterium]|nr:NAD-dependent epimerase/dehydratase family protein [Cytophagales bacterium]